jgi:hypothetical protein
MRWLGLALLLIPACSRDNPLAIGAGEPDAACLGSSCGDAGTGGDAGAPTCPYQGPPLVDVNAFDKCTLCDGAHCLPNVAVPAALQSQLQACDAQSSCVPDELIASAGLGVPDRCRSLGGVEGRCLSRCLPAVIAEAGLLPQSTCDAAHRCVPCFDPTSGAATGACTLACDQPVEAAPPPPMCPYTGPALIDPSTLMACPSNPMIPDCQGAHCLPTSRIPSALSPSLVACDGANACVPDEMIRSGGQGLPASCRSIANVEGRCLSRCLPAVAAQDPFLPRDSCPDSHRCVPCFDPTSGADTGACRLACDKPAEEPFTAMCGYHGPAFVDPAALPGCAPECGGAHCLPATRVPSSLTANLAACEGGGKCVPDELIAFGALQPPPACRSLLNVEGRCLSTCLPDVAAQADALPSTGCGENERCVPCFDPTTGQDTQACRTPCDMPKELPLVLSCPYKRTDDVIHPASLPACTPACAGAHCLSDALVPTALAKQVADCDATHKCVPDELIRSGGLAVPDACRSVAGVEGRCLSRCLPAVAAQGVFVPQSTCDDTHRCVPCYDPLSGADTGACRIACDAPLEAPKLLQCPYYGDPIVDVTQLPACGPACDGAHCLPSARVPAALASQLASCTGGKCVPDSLIVNGAETPPPTCRSLNDAEGRCLSKCLPGVAAQVSRLPDCDAPTNSACVPCFDPISGGDTNACHIACDAPTEAPKLFPRCCSSIGSCLPTSLVPQAQQSKLQTDTCAQNQGILCVPQVYIDDPGWKGSDCNATYFSIVPLGAGKCVPGCIKGLTGLGQNGCPANFRCAPCKDLLGNPTGAC